MLLRWFISRTVRRAVELRRHAVRLLHEQRDLLATEAIDAMSLAIANLDRAVRSSAPRAQLEEEMNRLIAAAEQWLRPFPAAAIRENIKEFLVAGTVIIAFTTFFLQLTKIPTGSMQPTLFGIDHVDLRNRPEVPIPSRLERLFQYWVHGDSYFELIAASDCQLKEIEPPRTVFPFVKRQRLLLGDQWHTLWFVPDDVARRRAGLSVGQPFRKGESVLRLKVSSGDHLLVDRVTYNFRRPQRGEIIVFKTSGIPLLDADQGQLYIKRMVALPGERVRIGNDQHLVIDGRRLDASTPHFESVYSFDPASPGPNRYFGHVNQFVANRWGWQFQFHYFHDAGDELRVPADQYLALGDNTLNSLDARAWGGLPKRNVIGRHWFVYWPIGPRFGWGQR